MLTHDGNWQKIFKVSQIFFVRQRQLAVWAVYPDISRNLESKITEQISRFEKSTLSDFTSIEYLQHV